MAARPTSGFCRRALVLMSPAMPATNQPPELKRRNLRNFVNSVRYSLEGFFAACRHEPSFREDLLFVLILIPFAIILPVNAVSTALMIGSLFLIIIVELLNSALEWTIDYISTAQHPVAKRVKDMASAAVFLSFLNCAVIWIIVLWPKWELIQHFFRQWWPL